MEAFIARQPIFNRNKQVVAYELLFRSGPENVFRHHDQDAATSKVISNAFLLFGLDQLTAGKKAFINFTRKLLVEDYFRMLPKAEVVIEVLENIEPDQDVVEALVRARGKGYRVALDDFVYEEKFEPLLKLADIVKVDILGGVNETHEKMARLCQERGIKLLAEKVETWDDFERTRQLGFHYFQGYFFNRPLIISGRDVPALKVNQLRLLRELNYPGMDLEAVLGIVKSELSLTYKLLKYLNSPFFGLRNKVKSLRQAMALLGENEVRKWAMLVTMADLGEDKPAEVIVSSIVRAKFMELMAPQVGLGEKRFEMFLTGMLSMMDVIMDRPLEKILGEIAVEDEVRAALLGQPSRVRQVYELCVNYEQGRWDELARLSRELGIKEDVSPKAFLDAVGWADQSFAAI